MRRCWKLLDRTKNDFENMMFLHLLWFWKLGCAEKLSATPHIKVGMFHVKNQEMEKKNLLDILSKVLFKMKFFFHFVIWQMELKSKCPSVYREKAIFSVIIVLLAPFMCLTLFVVIFSFVSQLPISGMKLPWTEWWSKIRQSVWMCTSYIHLYTNFYRYRRLSMSLSHSVFTYTYMLSDGFHIH